MKLSFAFLFLLAINAVSSGISQVQCLNGKAVSERHTALWGNTVQKDWMRTVKKWYVPLWSKFYRYRVASEMLAKEIEEITPNEIGFNSCVYFEEPEICVGFNNKVKYTINGTDTSFIFKAPHEKAHEGVMKFELTDNSKFILGVTTWDDGEKGWTVISNTPVLDATEYARILGRVKSLGFDIMKAVFEDFSSCKDL